MRVSPASTPQSANVEAPFTKFILYACPTGELGQQLETYFQQSLSQWGPNTAHQYMPHCTLTGFFEDNENKANQYVQALRTVLTQPLPKPSIPIVEVTQLHFQEDWHGLELAAPWLQILAKSFADRVPSPTPLRLKNWLHVSLAYGFEPQHAESLQKLALNLINPQAAASWEVRLYKRLQNWHCLYTYPL